jgi:hypothetical protein
LTPKSARIPTPGTIEGGRTWTTRRKKGRILGSYREREAKCMPGKKARAGKELAKQAEATRAGVLDRAALGQSRQHIREHSCGCGPPGAKQGSKQQQNHHRCGGPCALHVMVAIYLMTRPYIYQRSQPQPRHDMSPLPNMLRPHSDKLHALACATGACRCCGTVYRYPCIHSERGPSALPS